MLVLRSVLLMLLLFSSVSYATDTAAVAAALPDEASECRYLLMLCKETRIAAKLSEQYSVEFKEKMERDKAAKRSAKAADITLEKSARLHIVTGEHGIQVKRNAPDSQVEKDRQAEIAATRNADTTGRAAGEALRRYEAADLQYKTGTQNTIEAAKVIRAKHEKLPACFQECADILSMENYK